MRPMIPVRVPWVYSLERGMGVAEKVYYLMLTLHRGPGGLVLCTALSRVPFSECYRPSGRLVQVRQIEGGTT